MSTTTNTGLNQPAYNSTSPTWDQPLNFNETILDAVLGNTTSVAMPTGASSTTTLTGPSSSSSLGQTQAMRIVLTGALSANQILQFPSGVAGKWVIYNTTSGSFSVTVSSAGGGTAVSAPQGFNVSVYSDGTNIRYTDDGVLSSNVSNATATATGATTARTIANYFADVLNVLDFGADPTGATSSVTAFQNAINAKSTSQIQVIYVPSGTYLGDMTTLSYGTGMVVWQEQGNVTYSTAAPSGEFCVRNNTTVSGDNTRAWSYGFNGLQYDYKTGTNRPVLRISRTNNAATTPTGNYGTVSIQNSVNNTSGQLSNNAIENCLVMELDVYTNATSAASPAFGIIQGTMFKYNISYGSFIASNFVARDQTTRGSSNSLGSLVAMELDVVASGPDTSSRIGLDIVGRGYNSSSDGSTSMYAGCRVRPANSGVVTNEPMAITYGYKTEVNSLGSITNHFFADGPCSTNGYHFLAVSDGTVQGKAKIGSQRNTNGQTIAQLEFAGWNTSNVLTSYTGLYTTISDSTAGSEDGTLTIKSFVSGVNTSEAAFHNGVVVGSATGNALGTGKINVSGGVYLNGTAYTNPDYVFEKAYTGQIVKFADKLGADTYVSRTIEETEQYTKDNLALPGFGQDHGLDYLNGAEMLLARLEEAYLYIFQLNERIKILEKS